MFRGDSDSAEAPESDIREAAVLELPGAAARPRSSSYQYSISNYNVAVSICPLKQRIKLIEE